MRRKKITALLAALLGCGMLGLSFLAVPLYETFCRITGYGGTTQKATEIEAGEQWSGEQKPGTPKFTVRFDSNIDQRLNWDFYPVLQEMEIASDLEITAYYRARNRGDVPLTGVATFNVTPFKAGSYFNKIECFCFSKQTLQPGEEVDMPVLFYIDKDIASDPETDEVRTITLSYTFYPDFTPEQ